MAVNDAKFIASGKLRLRTERFGDPADPVALLVMGTSTPGLGRPDELVETLDDPLLPHGGAVAAAIPHARLETIKGMGHSLLSPELPRRVAELILRHTDQYAGIYQERPTATPVLTDMITAR